MLRTVFTIGLFAVLGVMALKLAFGALGVAFGLFLWVAGLALRIALVGLVIYGIVRLVSPETARRWRERFSSGV